MMMMNGGGGDDGDGTNIGRALNRWLHTGPLKITYYLILNFFRDTCRNRHIQQTQKIPQKM